MIKVYICSPYSGNTAANVHIACLASRVIALNGGLPITPHIYLTQFLDDTIGHERALAFEINYKLLKACDILYVLGEVSPGMRKEILIATKIGIEIRYFNSFKKLLSIVQRYGIDGKED